MDLESDAHDQNGDPPLSIHLDAARRWARAEIARLKHGEAPEDVQARARYADAERLRRKPLLECVELMLRVRAGRGWTEAYADRMRSAVHTGLPADLLAREVGSFSPFEFGETFEKLPISPGNRRLIRSLLSPLLENLSVLAGLRLRLDDARSHSGHAQRGVDRAEEIAWLRSRRPEDVEALIEALRDTKHGWRARIGLELCLRLPAPISRVLAGRWDQVDGRVWRWLESEQRWWVGRAKLSTMETELLDDAFSQASSEGLVSPFWFPSQADQSKPVRNLDRAWRAAVQSAGWPALSLGATCRELREQMIFRRLMVERARTRSQ